MKKVLLIIGLLSGSASLFAQEVENTVSVGAGSANQVWYSLDNGEMETAPLSSWDLAFGIPKGSKGLGSIHINNVKGLELSIYPNSTRAGWDDVNISGFDAWPKLYNLPYSWSHGAFNISVDPNNAMDYSWGVYYMGPDQSRNHHVIGDSLYIIKFSDGSYKKLLLDDYNPLTSEFTFKYADLDGQNEKEVKLDFKAYSDKGFVYYSIENNEVVDVAPKVTEWQLLFTQYVEQIAMGPTNIVPYPVTGVLLNSGVKVAAVNNVEDPESYKDYEQLTFTDTINKIGYNWKTYDMGNGTYTISKTVYFIQVPRLDANGTQVTDAANNPVYDVWKLRFTGFGGGANGNITFVSEKLSGSILGMDKVFAGQNIQLYPNPSNAGYINLDFSDSGVYGPATISVSSLQGERLFAADYNLSGSLMKLETSSLERGIYILNIENAGNVYTQKIVIQ